MSKETLKEVKNAECLQQLADGPFKKFYLENHKEQKFLFSKVKLEELSLFSEMEFSLADVLKCRFIETYLKKRNIKRLTFKKNLLNHIKTNNFKVKVDEEKTIRKYAVRYIETGCADRDIGYETTEDMCYDNFKRDEQKYLTEALIYIFKDKNIMEKFKEDNYYKIKPIEAMLMFFILDAKNKEELKHIRFNEEHLIKRKFMKSLERYASAISDTRGLSIHSEYINDIYKKRLQTLKSDLPAIRQVLIKAERELAKNEKTDFEIVLKKANKCVKKLKAFIKRCEQTLQK